MIRGSGSFNGIVRTSVYSIWDKLFSLIRVWYRTMLQLGSRGHVDMPRELGPYHLVADAFESRCTVLEVTGVELRQIVHASLSHPSVPLTGLTIVCVALPPGNLALGVELQKLPISRRPIPAKRHS